MTKAIIASMGIALLLAAAAPAGAQDASPSPAAAAPEYQSSEPADGAELHEPPDQVKITFSEPLDSTSTLEVTDECGRQVDDGNVAIQLNAMSVGIAETPSGNYEASYRAVGIAGLTGTTEGAIGFFVHLGPSCDGGSSHHHHDDNDHDGNHHDHDSDGHDGHHGTAHDGHTDHSAGAHGDHSAGAHTTHSTEHDHHATGGPVAGGTDRKPSPVAAGRLPFTAPDGSAVVAMLAISLAVGVLGGFVLRVSNPS